MQPKKGGSSVIRNNYWSPYAVGILIGLTLLSTFYIMGWGLGVSRAVTRLTAYVLNISIPQIIEKNIYLKDYLRQERPLRDWIVFEVLGMAIGGFVGAITAKRFGIKVERGHKTNIMKRFFSALMGGVLVGFGTRLSRGCTTGVGLSGGATLALGSWAFIIGMFGGGYAIALFVRRLWK